MLRLIGPVLAATTVVLLASGIWLLVVGPENAGLVLLAHKASFVVWFALMAVHVLAHVRETFALSTQDWRPPRTPRTSAGRGFRAGAVAFALICGIALGVLGTPATTAWRDRGTGTEAHR